jgi:ankyrin repeat protein
MKKYHFIVTYLLITTLLYASCLKRDPYPMDIGRFNIAITNNDIETVEYYLRHYRNMSKMMLNAGTFLGIVEHWSPIMIAAYHVKEGTEILDLLVQNGGDINYASEMGASAVSLAVYTNNITALQYLVDKGADVNIRYDTGETSLMSATLLNHWDAVRILLENGADINIRTNFENNTAYHQIPWIENATAEERQKMFSLLMEYDPSLFDSLCAVGYTPFSLSLAFSQYDMIDFYLQHGASVSRALNSGFVELYNLLRPENREYIVAALHRLERQISGMKRANSPRNTGEKEAAAAEIREMLGEKA